jgi:hypothetical protein
MSKRDRLMAKRTVLYGPTGREYPLHPARLAVNQQHQAADRQVWRWVIAAFAALMMVGGVVLMFGQ